MAVRLSICIPVYNFGAYLGATLESIVRQATDDTEIVILDGGSTDDTAEVVRPFQERFAGLRYHRLERRGGIDRDMAKAVELAQGEYCWLFAGDDLMADGALADMLAQTREGNDVYVCETILCRLDMAPIGKHRLLDLESERVFELRDRSERLAYFALARNTAAFFSFCSSLMFRKSRWDAVAHDDAFVGSCWDHVARIFRMIPDGLRVKYLPVPHLLKRGENDSFIESGVANRYRITIEGYTRLADTFFGHDSVEARHIRRSVRAEHNLKALLDAKLEAHRRGQSADVALLGRMVEVLYVDRGLAVRGGRAIFRHAPLLLLGIAKPAYRALQGLRRMAG